ncbi:hypothetical protein LFYK43_12340 [Ligilactobacillus salitolerans]|uniref:Uncharacterized protein n=1 Tax=Ligilactobacillus salitolerans TaxID=1808352 RepID=A0A401ITF1_9LACO|nr:hypothetical protein [Ligilactobacillus salitolerans]GBG94775.1 hypothetical protein LFYK43_12340 [Ligilactobacillus salitolerans]
MGKNSLFTLRVGGYKKSELIELLKQNDIRLNQHGRDLLADSCFGLSKKQHKVKVLVVPVASLGLPLGGTLAEIYAAADKLSLGRCSLETAVYFRLQWQSQPNSQNSVMHAHKAPEGAVTVAAKINGARAVQGFYLRKVAGELWLRGYSCDNSFVFEPEDQFAFQVS